MLKPITQASNATSTAGSPSSKAGRDSYCVVAYQGERFIGVMSGMGKNRKTWDSDHGRRSAQRHAARLRIQRPTQTFRIEPN